MTRALAGVLAGCLVFAAAGLAGAGIPSPDLSFVVLDNTAPGSGEGLATCPIGDGPEFQYMTVTAKRANGTAIQGIPSTSFFFTVTGGNVTITAADAETDVNGEIRFGIVGDETIVWPTELEIGCQIYTVVLNDADTLICNTFDYDENDWVNPIDFSIFGLDFGGTNQKSDFDFDGDVDPIDFSLFGLHFGHQ
jgi:hypothetical protein